MRTSRVPDILRSIVAVLVAALCMFALLLGLAHLLRDGKPGDGKAAMQAKVANKSGKPGQATGKKPTTRTHVRMAATPAPKKPDEKKKEPKPEDLLNGQIVETAKPLVEEAPDAAKYLGKYDVKVAKEQKSHGQKTVGANSGRMTLDNPSALQSPQSDSRDPTQIPQHQHKAQVGSTGATAQEQVHPAPVMSPGVRPEAETGQDRARPSSPVVVSGEQDGLLLPSTSARNVLHNIQALSGSPGGNDYLPDVDDEGATNILNTRKFRYWDFFQRIKDKVATEWDPGEIWRTRDPTGQKYGSKDRYTVLTVTLDPEGALKRVRVARESGLDFLDGEAERAFQAAGPFPNPPRGLQNDRGEIEFKFGFMFELSTQRFRFLPPRM